MVVQLDRPSFNRLDSGPASPSGRGPDKPVKVLTHTKLVKELTHLVVIQELNAHNGEAALQGICFSIPISIQSAAALHHAHLICVVCVSK